MPNAKMLAAIARALQVAREERLLSEYACCLALLGAHTADAALEMAECLKPFVQKQLDACRVALAREQVDPGGGQPAC